MMDLRVSYFHPQGSVNDTIRNTNRHQTSRPFRSLQPHVQQLAVLRCRCCNQITFRVTCRGGVTDVTITQMVDGC